MTNLPPHHEPERLTSDFPFPCSQCSKATGFPIGTAQPRDKNETAIVWVRCRKCGHTWQMQRQPASGRGRRWHL